MLAIFLDTETNGLDPTKNRSIEIAFKIIDLYSGEEVDTFQTLIYQPESIWENSDLKSLEITGITYEEIKNGKDEKTTVSEILESFEKNNINNETAVFICQNPSFDRAFLSQILPTDIQNMLNLPYHWLDLASMYFAISIKNAQNNPGFFPWETGFTKDLIASVYNLPKEKTPHRAMNGVEHLILCYKSVVGFPLK